MNKIIETLAVAAEITRTQLSETAKIFLVRELEGLNERAVLRAIEGAAREVRPGGLTLAEIIKRIDDGRPSAAIAWASVPASEDDTAVWTAETAAAYHVAYPLIGKDNYAARMAFFDAYERAVSEARGERRKVQWLVSPGHDPPKRAVAVSEAIEAGLIGNQKAIEHIPPEFSGAETIGGVLNGLVRVLENKSSQ